jgi:hypothetical protein
MYYIFAKKNFIKTGLFSDIIDMMDEEKVIQFIKWRIF